MSNGSGERYIVQEWVIYTMFPNLAAVQYEVSQVGQFC
jgi:hypothetical protein